MNASVIDFFWSNETSSSKQPSSENTKDFPFFSVTVIHLFDFISVFNPEIKDFFFNILWYK